MHVHVQHGAMMLAVPPAARRKARIRIGRCSRHQRSCVKPAHQGKHQDGRKPSHVQAVYTLDRGRATRQIEKCLRNRRTEARSRICPVGRVAGGARCSRRTGNSAPQVLGDAEKPGRKTNGDEEERLPVAANILGLSSKLYKQVSSVDEEMLRRDAVTLQLGITYKEMSLSVTSGDSLLKVASGDRAPDAPGLNAEGESMRLFDLFRGPHFTLLQVFTSDDFRDDAMPDVQVVEVKQARAPSNHRVQLFMDAFGHFADGYGGGNGEYVLVRPDGYLGWVGSRQHLGVLHNYLARIATA